MKRFNFYFTYAWRSVLRGGQRSFFAVLCVSIGVAALVAMQSLAVSVHDSLLNDVSALAGGDVVARSSDRNTTLTPTIRDYLNGLKNNGQLQDWTSVSSNDLQLSGYFGFPPSLYTVDPAHFPLYGKVELAEPSNGDFRSLLSQPNSIILSKYLVDKNGYKLGQEIQATSGTLSFGGNNNSNGKLATLKLVGVIRPGQPGIPQDQGLVFGFGVVSQQTAAALLPDPTSANNGLAYYFKTAPGTNNDALKSQLNSQDYFDNPRTATEIQSQIATQLSNVDFLLSIVGLLAVLIGGVGVINTMLVVIGRRTTEIATVKALGLKTRQTLTIFTLEAMILGVMGSLLGVVIGVVLGLLIKGVAEGLFLRPLAWGIYPTPILIGLVVGILSAGVFGFLPAYAAGRIRPGVVLRQQSSSLPRVDGFTSFLLVLVMTFAMGLIAGVLLNNIGLGLIVAYVTLVVLSLITLGLYVIIWLVGKLPAPAFFGPSFKMALRSFSRHRGRTATTLLVMVTGLFFITFIVIVADSIKEPIRKAFDTNLGFNVLAVNLNSAQTAQLQSNFEKNVPGVEKVWAGTAGGTGANVTAINGRTVEDSISVSGRSLANGTTSLSPNGAEKILAGRNFQPGDMDKPVLIVTNKEADRLGVKAGDTIRLEFYGSTSRFNRNNSTNTAALPASQDFQVIGIVDRTSATIQFERDWVAPLQIIQGQGGINPSIFYMLVDRTQINSTLRQVQSQMIGGLVVDLSDLIDTFTHLLDQFLAFPLLLSLLSLISGAILIANNVALAMLERRTEIGVLKAIGAKRRRVLSILQWESGLVGLLGGLIGVGFGLLIAFLVPVLISLTSRSGSSNGFTITWSPLTALLLLLLSVGLAVAATLVSAWGAVQEKPLVVLRYE